MSTVMVVTGDVIAERMAGPAIRAWRIAEAAAAAGHQVSLVSTRTAHRPAPDFTLVHVPRHRLGDHVRQARPDVLVVQGLEAHRLSVLDDPRPVVVVDLYDPFHLEALEVTRTMPVADRDDTVRGMVGLLDEQLRRGDFFVCASERQRDLWLGHLAALGRLSPAVYDPDPTLRSIIDVVPFGTDDQPPQRSAGAGLRGSVPGIGPDDVVALWGGGIYDWFDPVTLVRAVAAVHDEVPTLRLVFLGGRHPNPDVPEMAAARAVHDEIERLGLADVVHVNEGWVPFDERVDWLLDADLAVSTHLEHLETAYSFRTRLLDALWAGLPVVATGGDVLAQRIEAAGAGIVVAPGDVEGVAHALRRLAGDAEERTRAGAAARTLAAELSWAVALEPLVRFLGRPRRAGDRPEGTALVPAIVQAPTNFLQPPTAGPRYWWAATRHAWRRGGVRLMADKATRRITGRRGASPPGAARD